MSLSTDQAIYRVRRYYRKGDVPKKYGGTYEIVDDNTLAVMAACDLTGKAVFATLVIMDHQDKDWQMKPNRKIMPSRWVITDPRQNIALQFDQKILAKIINPLYKVLLSLQNSEGKELFRLVDPRANIPDRILGVGPNDWALMKGDKPVAKIARLPRQTEPVKGIFGKLKNFLAGSDKGIISASSEHLLPAPVALGMLMLFEELTDVSGG
jgi:hypothetical protein